ncbi:hypothetical protein, partial [Pseudoalteromonas sp. Angola-4]|uniref:hypothetical protein n=2 Tax=unclassified Pseudoalteromonas TaxID=194690 RepID=UPI0023594028
SAISYQLSAISYQLSAISYQLSAISYQLSAISYQLSAISYQLEILLILTYVSRRACLKLAADDYKNKKPKPRPGFLNS